MSAFCPRQCALIHIEQVFAENIYTQRGQALHKREDDPGFEVRDGLRVERALPLFCDSLGLLGKADVVEFLPDGTPYPVEYKHGSRHKRADIAACDDVQLAAQALCLEEMFGRAVPEGALYYVSSRRRRTIAVDRELRARTQEAIANAHRPSATWAWIETIFLLGFEQLLIESSPAFRICSPNLPSHRGE